MALSAHLQELSHKHTHLDVKIQNELKNPLPDTLRLAELKKRKLYIKEQIRSLQSR